MHFCCGYPTCYSQIDVFIDSHKNKTALNSDIQLSSEHSILRGQSFELITSLMVENDLAVNDLAEDVKIKLEAVAEDSGDTKTVDTLFPKISNLIIDGV